jgi:hypothetical protein
MRSPPGEGRDGHSIANEFQGQHGNDEGGEEDGQEPLSRPSEGDDLALADVEGSGTA